MRIEPLVDQKDVRLLSEHERWLYSPALYAGPTDSETAFAPVVVSPRRPRVARLYLCNGRHSGAANFSPRGYFGPAAPDVFLFWLSDEQTLWQASAAELREFERAAAEQLSNRRTSFTADEQELDLGFWIPAGKRKAYSGETAPRRNALRLWFKASSNDLEIDVRVFDRRGRRARPAGGARG